MQIQHSPDGGTTWNAIGSPIVVTNGMGFFAGTVPFPGPGKVRAVLAGSTFTSLPLDG